jgi:hypothetical protein
MATPRTCPGTAGAIELAETLQLITGWLTTGPATLAPSFPACTGHPAYGLESPGCDLDRFTFLRRAGAVTVNLHVCRPVADWCHVPDAARLGLRDRDGGRNAARGLHERHG